MNPVATLSASQGIGPADLASVSPCAARTSSLYLSLFLVAGLSRAGDVAARSIAPERKLEASVMSCGSSFVRAGEAVCGIWFCFRVEIQFMYDGRFVSLRNVREAVDPTEVGDQDCITELSCSFDPNSTRLKSQVK